jgi:hypothetical protein
MPGLSSSSKALIIAVNIIASRMSPLQSQPSHRAQDDSSSTLQGRIKEMIPTLGEFPTSADQVRELRFEAFPTRISYERRRGGPIHQTSRARDGLESVRREP